MTQPWEEVEADLKTVRIEGYLNSDGRRISLPLISHIVDNLYVGGHNDYVDLGKFFTHVFSLYYPYKTHESVVHERVIINDATNADVSLVDEMVDNVIDALNAGGNVLVHCQAGINRSNLVAAQVLRHWKGMSSDAAIDLLRERRGQIVLANSGFERYLRSLD